MKNILVTGAAGFIGFNISNFLLNKNFRVFGIDNYDNYYSKKIKYIRIKILNKNKNFFFKKIDITNKKKLDFFLKKKI